MIVQSEKGELVGKEKADFEAEGVNILKIHEKLALNEIFDQTNECDMEKDQLQRYGLINFVGKNPKFVHRTFSEYLVTAYIIKNFKNLDEEILYKIVFDSFEYNMVLNFLEIELRSSRRFVDDLVFLQKLADFIEANIPKNLPKNNFLLHRCLYRNSETMALFLLECMKYVSNTCCKSVFSAVVLEEFRTVFLLATFCRVQSVIKKILQIVDERQIFPIAKFLLLEDKSGMNAFQYAFLTDLSNQSMHTFYEIFKKYFSKDPNNILKAVFLEKRDLETTIEYNFYPLEPLKSICDLRLKIAREFTGMSNRELVDKDNLFSIFLKSIGKVPQFKNEFNYWSKSNNLVLRNF